MKALRRIVLLTLALLGAYASLPAQTVPFFASKLHDSANNLATGTLTYQPVDGNGHLISYQLSSGGVVGVAQTTVPVTAGVFSTTIPDTSLTNPPNICFVVTLTTPSGKGLGPGFNCVQPHSVPTSSTDWCQSNGCDFDNLPPAVPTQVAQYGFPDMTTMWNSIVTAWLATSGNTVAQQSVTDAVTVNLNFNSAILSTVMLPLYGGSPAAPSSNTARTINVTGLTAGARFMQVINPMDTSPSTTPNTVTFGTGCVWNFGAGVAVPNNVLTIPPYASSSYLAYFLYDGTNCIGMVAN